MGLEISVHKQSFHAGNCSTVSDDIIPNTSNLVDLVGASNIY